MTLIKIKKTNKKSTKVLSHKKLVEAFLLSLLLAQNGYSQSKFLLTFHESYAMQKYIIFFNMKIKDLSDYIKEYRGPDCAPTI